VTGIDVTPADANLVPQNESGSTLGAGIRSERLRQGLTLTHVAEHAELSVSALSQIERSITDPSIGSLRRIASALQVPFFQFLVDPHRPQPVVRKADRRTISFPHRALQYQLVTPNLRGPFEILALELAPGAASGEEPLGHDSEECMVILRGPVEVEVAAHVYVLEAGDSIYIQRAAPHRAVNRGQHTAEILMVISPANTF
jgi:transcriptional regulator with XRE-family HTH domain